MTGLIAIALLLVMLTAVFAAPTPTARTTPTGYMLYDGLKTVITLSNKPGIQFWEQTVTPPGIDGGEATNTTTMHNAAWRTMRPKKLKTLKPVESNAGYDPDVLSDIIAQCNVEQTITVWWPDGSSLAFFGYLQTFEPQETKEGEFPLAKCTVIPTNWDPQNNVEAAPVFTAAAGT